MKSFAFELSIGLQLASSNSVSNQSINQSIEKCENLQHTRAQVGRVHVPNRDFLHATKNYLISFFSNVAPEKNYKIVLVRCFADRVRADVVPVRGLLVRAPILRQRGCCEHRRSIIYFIYDIKQADKNKNKKTIRNYSKPLKLLRSPTPSHD